MAAIILLLLPFFLFPVISSINIGIFSEILAQATLKATIIRSLLFALVSSSLCIVIGLAIASLFQKISFTSLKGKLLSFLFVPFLIGNVTTAFIFKMLLLENNLKTEAFQDPLYLFLLLLGIQLWQFASLFIYLFWMSNQQIDKDIWMYADLAGMSNYEKFRDIILPQNKNLIILLFLLGFVFSFYEDAKLQLIFNASPGTDSELISHWLYRNFRSDLLINFNYASTKITTTSLFAIFPSALLFFSTVSGILIYVINKISKSRFALPINIVKNSQTLTTYFFLFILIVLALPFVFVLINIPVNFIDNLQYLVEPLYLSGIAAIVSSFIAIVFGISIRLSSNKYMSEYNSVSLISLSLLFILLLMPPILILIASFEWTSILFSRDKFSIIAFWMLGHSLLSLPILGGFAMLNHFKVKANELEFLDFSKVGHFEKIKWSFLKRFKTEYVLIVIFAFSIIWNEALLNRVFSDYIQSFVSTLLRQVVGRSANYSVGMSFMLVSLIGSVLCVLTWIYTISNSDKKALND